LYQAFRQCMKQRWLGLLNVLPYKNMGEVGSHAVYPRASKCAANTTARGNEDASGSCCTSSLPLNFSIPERASKNESCFFSGSARHRLEPMGKVRCTFDNCHDLAAEATASAVASSIFS
jgi:hypothetical protein